MRKKDFEPYLIVGKKEHPFGKTEELYFDDIRMYIHAGYLWYGENGKPVNDVAHVTLQMQTKDEYAWIYFSEKDARRLYESLGKIFNENKKGHVKKTYAGLPVTKYRRYKDNTKI